MAGRDTQSGMEPLSCADMLETLSSIIRSSGTQGILLHDLLCECERLTGTPQANVKQYFTPKSFVGFLETEIGISYEHLGSDSFRLFWTRAQQPAPPCVAPPLAASVLEVSSASPPCTSAPTVRFRQQEGLSEDYYAAVYVSHVYSVGDFYVQLRGDDTSLRLEKLMIDLKIVYEGGTSKAFTIEEIVEGMPCAAQFTYADGSFDWYRAVITSLNCEPHLCCVLCIDYGTPGTVARTRLRRLKSEFFELPTQAIRASLAYLKPVTPSGWTAESTAFFRQLVDGDKVFMCKLVGPQGDSKYNVALCDVSCTSEVFMQDVLVEEGHAMPLEDAESSLGTPKMLPQPPLPVPNGIGSAGEPPVRSPFGRGRAQSPALAAPVNCAVKMAAVPERPSSMLMKVEHFRPTDHDLNVQQQADGAASESFGGPAEKQRTMLGLPPPARRAQSEAPSWSPVGQTKWEDLESRMAALPFCGPVPSRHPVLAHPAEVCRAKPRYQPSALVHRPAPVHKPPVPAASELHCVSAVALGESLPAAVGPAAPSSVHVSATLQVPSVGGAVGFHQQDDDVMSALREALDQESCLPQPVSVEHLSTGRELGVLNRKGFPYISTDEVCELLCLPHADVEEQLENLHAQRQQLRMHICKGFYLECMVDELTLVERAIAELEKRVGTKKN